MVAILFDNKKRQPPVVAVAMAKREFAGAMHTQGEKARVVVFNPADCPPEMMISGLSVYTDVDVPRGKIRIADEYRPSGLELAKAGGLNEEVHNL